jgi:hypothetical protein
MGKWGIRRLKNYEKKSNLAKCVQSLVKWKEVVEKAETFR